MLEGGFEKPPPPSLNKVNIYGALHFLFEKTVNTINWGLSDFILLCFSFSTRTFDSFSTGTFDDL